MVEGATDFLRKIGHIVKRNGEASKSSAESSLKKEWRRQADNFVRLGFHKELNVSEKAYRASLPRFEPQPKAFEGRFDTPLLVETRIPVINQAKLAGVAYFLEGLDVRDWAEDPQGYQTPYDNPYTAWVQDGTKNLQKSTQEVRAALESDERGGTEYDGIAFYIAHPDVVKNHNMDLPGTSLDFHNVPYLGVRVEGPQLNRRDSGAQSPWVGALTCGR